MLTPSQETLDWGSWMGWWERRRVQDSGALWAAVLSECPLTSFSGGCGRLRCRDMNGVQESAMVVD